MNRLEDGDDPECVDVLSFEEFTGTGPHPNYDNFPQYFQPIGIGSNLLRQRPFFVRFQNEHPELEKQLREAIILAFVAEDSWSLIRRLDRELYVAYKIMKGYGASDKQLFA